MVGILWRAEWDPVDDTGSISGRSKLRGMFAAFAALGVTAEPVVYSDARADEIREQLLRLDGVLVWVNPIEHGLDRSTLDPLLRDVADQGVWVSAHPDVILKMATKQVLVDTASMSWSVDTHLYRTLDQLRDELPTRLALRGPLVLKQHRGMGGAGVWKVEAEPGDVTHVRVQHATKGSGPELLSTDEFLDRCRPYFAGEGRMVEQAYQSRLAEGMIRVYLCLDEVVGFAHQFPRGLMPPAADLPAAKTFERATASAYRHLRTQMESTWVPELRTILGIERDELPVIWDADFFYGPKTEAGEDTYVLCEINASSTFAFPEHAMPTVAQSALDRIDATGPAARS